jgi:CheY-like chemotaxis protein
MPTLRRAYPERQLQRRVLVVDDDLDTVQSMAMLIKMLGHEVQFAISGFAAINIANAFRPEIVLLDLGLPDLEGHVVAKRIKSERGLENVRIIAISGRSKDADRQDALAAGCEVFHAKPVDPAVVEALLAKA